MRSAFELPARERATIQNALNETFSADVHVSFETAPHLICGIELARGWLKTGWSIEGYLASLAKSVGELLKERENEKDKMKVPAAPKPEAEEPGRDPLTDLYLFYNRSAPGATFAPVSERVLPLDREWRRARASFPWPTKALPEVIGGDEAMLRALVRGYVFVSLFRASAESLASENASRLAAMQRAEKNISESLESSGGVPSSAPRGHRRRALRRRLRLRGVVEEHDRSWRLSKGAEEGVMTTERAEGIVSTARALVAGDKGLLAMDESNGTCNRRFAPLGIPQTEDSRRAYRELILTTPALGECISGVILYDETIRQRRSDGVMFAQVAVDAGMVSGIKVDIGAKDLAARPGEKVTEGLDGLRVRLGEYSKMGARFAKWRGVIALGEGLPSGGCIDANAQALARYAALCQEAGLVPVVEPEVLMDGDHGARAGDLAWPGRPGASRAAGAVSPRAMQCRCAPGRIRCRNGHPVSGPRAGA